MAFPEYPQNTNEVSFKETIYDGISYICPSWEDMGRMNFELAKKIIEARKSFPPFDRLVALARGGWTWGRALADSLKIPELSSLRVKTYTDVNEHHEPEIVQPLSDPIHGQSILLFDEVVDSGVTIKKGVDYLTVMGAREIKVAALCSKPSTEINPDYYAFSSKSWVVFPHEIREFIEKTSIKWLENGHLPEEMLGRFTKIGIPEYEAALYLKLYFQKSI